LSFQKFSGGETPGPPLYGVGRGIWLALRARQNNFGVPSLNSCAPPLPTGWLRACCRGDNAADQSLLLLPITCVGNTGKTGEIEQFTLLHQPNCITQSTPIAFDGNISATRGLS